MKIDQNKIFIGAATLISLALIVGSVFFIIFVRENIEKTIGGVNEPGALIKFNLEEAERILK